MLTRLPVILKRFLLSFIFVAGCFAFDNSTQAGFTDVNPDHPYYEAISALQKNGVLEGYADGTYRPNDPIDRASALKIILEGSHISIENDGSQAPFIDVTGGLWYTKYVNQAKTLGIVSGDSDTGLFRPGDPVILAENLKILLEANHRTLGAGKSSPYLDIPAGLWFTPYFEYAKKLGLFPQAEGGNVDPAQRVTRGMMADLMYQLTFKPDGYEEGKATYYGMNAHGDGTASGERFDAYAMTAAHLTLPFGTMVKVTNLANGKEVTVKINDRGPYGDGRIIDLSQAAFEAIAPLSNGVIRVSVVPIEAVALHPVNGIRCEETGKMEYLAKNSYDDITLDQAVPDHFLNSEVWEFSGRAERDEREITAFLINEAGRQYPFQAEIEATGRFSFPIYFPAPGKYSLGLALGSQGESIIQTIWVLDDKCGKTSEMDDSLAPPTEVAVKVEEGNFKLDWENSSDYELTKVTFKQGEREKIYIVHQKNSLVPHYADFDGWQAGPVEIELQTADLESESILSEKTLSWSPAAHVGVKVTQHLPYDFNQEAIQFLDIPSKLESKEPFVIQVDPLTNLNEKAFITLPSGEIETHNLMSPSHNSLVNDYGVRVLPAAAEDVELAYIPKQTQGVHVFEINDETGRAVLNIPIYPEEVYPLLPNPIDLTILQDKALDSNLNLVRLHMLSLVNEDRTKEGLNELKIDPSLNQLAQMKAEDMAEKGYISHWNEDGLTANDLRKEFNITPFVAENIAWNNSPIAAEYGLMSSAAHRLNILNETWKQAGFGIVKNPEGGYLFVQIFSDDPLDFSDLEKLRTKILSSINQNRETGLTLNSTLNQISQNWTDRMISEDFFGLISPDEELLVDELQKTGNQKAMATYLVGNSSFEGALDQIQANGQLQETRWKEIGIGMAQDEFGIIKITLSYSE